MNDMQKGVITLIKSAITEEKLPLPQNFSIAEAYDFIIKHRIMLLAYDGAVRCGISKNEPAMQKLFGFYIQGMMHSEKQMNAVNELYSAFEKNGIDYLPLKGCNMKQLYPKPELRVMGDADILIKREQYEIIKSTVEKLGFCGGEEITHHFVWGCANLHLELHTMPMPRNYKIFYDYYGDGWSRAVKTKTNRFEYSREDSFIFLFVHFAKHYLDGGIGLRHVTDLYVFLKKYPEMDFGYIEEETKKLGLEKFYKNIILLIENWFGEGNKATEETVEAFILESGNWGEFESHALANSARNSKGKKIGNEKLKYIFRTVFPGTEGLDEKYHWAEKSPLLLPFAWAKRGFDVIFFRRERVSRKLRYIETIDAGKVEIYLEKLKKAGFNV